MNSCHTWTPRTSPAIATMIFYRSLKATKAISYMTLFRLPEASPRNHGSYSVLDKHKDALLLSSSSRTIFLRQRRSTTRFTNSKDTAGSGRVTAPSHLVVHFDCAAIVDFFFIRHTRYVCSLGMCCSIFKHVFLFPFEEEKKEFLV